MATVRQSILAKLAQFREIIFLDFEFTAIPGELQDPICCVAKELLSGRLHRIFRGGFGAMPPWPIGPDVLVIAYLFCFS